MTGFDEVGVFQVISFGDIDPVVAGVVEIFGDAPEVVTFGDGVGSREALGKLLTVFFDDFDFRLAGFFNGGFGDLALVDVLEVVEDENADDDDDDRAQDHADSIFVEFESLEGFFKSSFFSCGQVGSPPPGRKMADTHHPIQTFIGRQVAVWDGYISE